MRPRPGIRNWCSLLYCLGQPDAICKASLEADKGIANQSYCQSKNWQSNTLDFSSLTICDWTNLAVGRNKTQPEDCIKIWRATFRGEDVIVWGESNYKYL